MGRVQHKTNLRPESEKQRQAWISASHECAHIEIYLPEPASLQEGESAAQQLQKDVASVEDLQEGNERLSEDGVEEKLMYVDVQHRPAMEVVEEEKSCQNIQTVLQVRRL